MRISGPLLSVVGLGFLLMAWLMANGRLPRNDLVGMRTRATLTSDAAWNAAHRASAWSVAVAGLVLLAVGLWLLLTNPSPGAGRNVVLGSCVLVVIVVVGGGLQAHQVAKSTTGTSDG